MPVSGGSDGHSTVQGMTGRPAVGRMCLGCSSDVSGYRCSSCPGDGTGWTMIAIDSLCDIYGSGSQAGGA